MIWGCFVGGVKGPLVMMKGTINQDAYIDCLLNDFLPGLSNLSLKFLGSISSKKTALFATLEATPAGIKRDVRFRALIFGQRKVLISIPLSMSGLIWNEG